MTLIVALALWLQFYKQKTDKEIQFTLRQISTDTSKGKRKPECIIRTAFREISRDGWGKELWQLYAFFWVIPRRLHFVCRQSVCSIFIGGCLYEEPPAYEDGTECSETSAHKFQTPGNNPEESIQHLEHGEILKSRKLWQCLPDCPMKPFPRPQNLILSRRL